MVISISKSGWAALLIFLVFALTARGGAERTYQLGEIADADVVTPVALQIVDPVATQALHQRLTDEVLFVVRFAPTLADEVERSIRQNVQSAKTTFLKTLRHALNGRSAEAGDLDSPAYLAASRIVAGELNKGFPLPILAPLWTQGTSDEAVLQALIQPVRDVMTQPILADKTALPLSSNQAIQLATVSDLAIAPDLRTLETKPMRFTAGRVLSLWRARRLVETSSGGTQADLARYAATFLQANALPDPDLTQLLRAKRVEGVSAHETYAPAQVILRRGQRVDQKVLAALDALREKTTLGTLQNKLAEEQILATQLSRQTYWFVAGLCTVLTGLLVILWRIRAANRATLALALAPPPAFTLADEATSPETESERRWKQRALLAESKVERAHAAIKAGILGWMREKLFQSLFRQRADLLSAQRKAELEMGEWEQRLESLQAPLQDRIRAYEKRIEDLERELAAKGETNRELLGARIAVTRQHLHQERERGDFSAN
ncbi:MAG TPA: hypothetical protein PLN52_18210 [Opitutaceae bacterium]|nr:hypothetical protein [Opitutaceae bacterium]